MSLYIDLYHTNLLNMFISSNRFSKLMGSLIFSLYKIMSSKKKIMSSVIRDHFISFFQIWMTSILLSCLNILARPLVK